MTTQDQVNLQIAHNYTICKLKEEEVIPIPLSDWFDLNSDVGMIESPKNLFTLIGTVFLGIFGSGLFAAIALSNELSRYSFRIWFITITFLIIGVLLILIDYYYLKKYATFSKTQVLNKMKHIEKKYIIIKLENNTVNIETVAPEHNMRTQ